MTYYGSFHYGVYVSGGHRKVDVLLLFEHLKDALKEAKSDLHNSRRVAVLSLASNNPVVAKTIYESRKKVKLVKLKSEEPCD